MCRATRAGPADERGQSAVPPRIHGELLKLGFEVAQSSVAQYMVKRCGSPSQGIEVRSTALLRGAD